MNLAVIIAAAGRSRRFGSDKLSESIAATTVLEISIEAMRAAQPKATMIVVLDEDRLGSWRERLERGFPGIRLVAGGERRQDSVRLGVLCAARLGAERVAIHDAARPAVHSEDIRRVVDAVEGADGAILCSRPVDTVKTVDDVGVVIETLARGALRLAQTPQVFRISALEDAWSARGSEPEWSDESALLEDCGFAVRAVEANHPNPKLTLRSDLELIRLLAEHG